VTSDNRQRCWSTGSDEGIGRYGSNRSSTCLTGPSEVYQVSASFVLKRGVALTVEERMNNVIGKALLVQRRKRIPEYIGVMQVIRQPNHAYGSARRNICQTGIDPGNRTLHFVPRLPPPVCAVRRYPRMRADQ
jgi:hypothetical protein